MPFVGVVLVLIDQLIATLVVRSGYAVTSGSFLGWTQPMLIQATATVILALFYWKLPLYRKSLTLVLAGASSNTLTYLRFHQAVDYLNIGFAFSNLADALIVLGIVLVFLVFMRKNKP